MHTWRPEPHFPTARLFKTLCVCPATMVSATYTMAGYTHVPRWLVQENSAVSHNSPLPHTQVREDHANNTAVCRGCAVHPLTNAHARLSWGSLSRAIGALERLFRGGHRVQPAG
jgi:hypothetical protein